MNIDRFKELAAGFGSGALDSAEQSEFQALLRSASPEAKAESAGLIDAAAAVALSLAQTRPSANLRAKILSAVQAPAKPAATPELFEFLAGSGDTGWIPLPVPGAFVKLLSVQKEKGYAVVLGKLEPGTYYPPHSHIGAEQIFVLSGDLHIGHTIMKAGDFHNAKAGSTHGENYSEGGCTIMAIVSTEDLAVLVGG